MWLCFIVLFLTRLVCDTMRLEGVWRIAAKNCGTAWQCPSTSAILRVPHYPMKKHFCLVFLFQQAFLGRFQFYAICRVRRTIIDVISSNFHLASAATTLASGCRSSSKREAVTCRLGTNKFSINRRRATGDDRSDFAISMARRRVSSSRRRNNAEICHVCDRNTSEQRIIQK